MEQGFNYAVRDLVARGGIKSEAFGRWLIDARGKRDRGSVIRHVAKILQPIGQRFSKSDFSRKEHGELPSVPQLFALAEVLGGDINDLVRLIASDIGVAKAALLMKPVIALPSDDGLAIARWFDEKSAVERRTLMKTFGIEGLAEIKKRAQA